MTKDELERQAAALVEANPAHMPPSASPWGKNLFLIWAEKPAVSAPSKRPSLAPPWSRCGRENCPWTSR